jgi:DNA-binding MarR family transcriptional regulator
MENDGSVSQRLFQSFMRFRRLKWMEQQDSCCRPSDIRLLFCIQRGQDSNESGLKISEISHLLRVRAPTVTQQVSGMEAQGLVERRTDENDKRVIRVRLTNAGEAVTETARKRTHAWFSGLVKYLGEEDSEHLVHLLDKVSEFSIGDDKL